MEDYNMRIESHSWVVAHQQIMKTACHAEGALRLRSL